MIGDKNSLFNNGEGYPDPTAYSAIKAENVLEGQVSFLIKVIKYIANNAGFDIINRIELKDRASGRVFR